MLKPIPQAVSNALDRLLSAGVIWRYAALRHPGRASTWAEFDRLTAGDCEQLVEYHTRRATRALIRFEMTKSPYTARTAAQHIYRARLYRAKFHDLLGTEPAERDMPFPRVTDEEAKAIEQEHERGNSE